HRPSRLLLFPYTTLFRSPTCRASSCMTSRNIFLSTSVGEMYSLKRNKVSTNPSPARCSPTDISAKLSASRSCFSDHSFCGLAFRSEEHTSELQSLRHLVC